MSTLSDKEIRTCVLEFLKEDGGESRSLQMKKLHKKVVKAIKSRSDDDNGDDGDDGRSKKVYNILLEMELGKKISIVDDMVTKLSKNIQYSSSSNGDSNGDRKRDREADVHSNGKQKKSYRSEDINRYNSGAYNKYMPTVKPIEDVKFNVNELWKNGEQVYRQQLLSHKYLITNPDNITRLFVGNLNRKITEEQLTNAIEGITHIKWITDKLSQEFYGSTFVEVKDSNAAIRAVSMDKQKLLGRPLKIYYCPPAPGAVWPPGAGDRLSTKPAQIRDDREHPTSAIASPGVARERRVKPEGCNKLFMGNVAYEIDDQIICDFFKDCGEIVGLRWLTHKDTGNFRGCGYIQFRDTEGADKAKALDGSVLLKRPIRIDWTD